MKYFIYQNHQVLESNEVVFLDFLTTEVNNYLFSPYSKIIEDKQLSLETFYFGAIENDQASSPAPFKLFIFKDEAELKSTGIEMKHTLDDVEDFSDFESMATRRSALIDEFEAS